MRPEIEALRARIASLEGRPHAQVQWEPSGDPALDRVVGGLPAHGLISVVGKPGDGRASLVARWLALGRRYGRGVAWVDTPGTCHPPALAALGVDLAEFVLLRPLPQQVDWTVRELARSGSFGDVIVVDPPSDRSTGSRWKQVAEQGATRITVLTQPGARRLGAPLRLRVRPELVELDRHPTGRRGHYPREEAPWRPV